MSRTIVAYFSRTGENYVSGSIIDLPVGNTEVAAGYVRDATGGDIFRIETVSPYPENYSACTGQAQAEKRADARPQLVDLGPDMSGYDTVYLGYPNWCGTVPMAVLTFLEAHDFSGKRILPFCTNEGSGMGSSDSDIRKACPGAEVGRGLSITGGSVKGSRPAVEEWVKSNQ